MGRIINKKHLTENPPKIVLVQGRCKQCHKNRLVAEDMGLCFCCIGNLIDKGLRRKKGNHKIMISTDLTTFIAMAEDHYWGSLEKERDIILQHLYAIAKMVTKNNYENYNESLKLTKKIK